MQPYQSEIIDLFSELLAIPSPSGKEEMMAEYVINKLRQLIWMR